MSMYLPCELTTSFNLREEFLVLFLRDKPSIYDFENELKKYNLIQAELATEVDEFRWKLRIWEYFQRNFTNFLLFRYGQMMVSNVSFKECLSTEVNQWIQGIGRAMHSKYR